VIGVKDLEPLRKMGIEGAALSGPVPAAMIPDVAKVVLVNPGGQNSAARVAATLAANSAATRLSE
jgi:hypothetical protein